MTNDEVFAGELMGVYRYLDMIAAPEIKTENLHMTRDSARAILLSVAARLDRKTVLKKTLGPECYGGRG